jgi:hypothetical protein
MQVAVTVALIAVGTALLSALIVAADLDLAVIRGWENLFPARRAAPSRNWEPVKWPVPEIQPPAPPISWHPPTAVPVAPLFDAKRQEAEEWLAAANSNRLAEYRQGLFVNADAPATRLQDALAARRSQQEGERAA